METQLCLGKPTGTAVRLSAAVPPIISRIALVLPNAIANTVLKIVSIELIF
ncbi:hypothetical protein ACWXV6_14740 [Pantoea ananatis]